MGSYANFIGSHFWNLQDEVLGLQSRDASSEVVRPWLAVNSNILYQEGNNGKTPTYTPRLVMVDLCGSQGSLLKGGAYASRRQDEIARASASGATASWGGKVCWPGRRALCV